MLEVVTGSQHSRDLGQDFTTRNKMNKCAIRVGIPVTRMFDLQGSRQLLISLNIPRAETDGKLIKALFKPCHEKIHFSKPGGQNLAYAITMPSRDFQTAFYT